MKLTMEQARAILADHVTQPHLLTHALAVSAAMEELGKYYGEDPEHWAVLGYLHDIDYEKFPEEHCQHVSELLTPYGVSPEDIRSIMAHGHGICVDCPPETQLEKSLYAVDELTGIVSAAALMRPTGIADMPLKSLKKKFKDKAFAAKCDRALITAGAEAMGMELATLMELTLKGMAAYGEELGLIPHEE